MATEVRTISTSTDNLKRGPRSKSPRPVLDEEGNILPELEELVPVEPVPPVEKVVPQVKAKDTYWATSPIARLAAVGALDRPIPTAGQVGIERSKEPELDIPPACFLYEEQRPWVLGKLNKEALDVPEPAAPVQLPKHVTDLLDVLEQAANKVCAARVARAADEANDNVPVEDDSDEMYIKERALALAAFYTPEKESQTDPDSAKTPGKKSGKPKSRNASTSPGHKGAKRPITGKTSAPATISASRTTAQTSPRTPTQPLKPKTASKSPGRGDAPPAKLATVSQRSSTAPKKIANAK